MDSTPRDEPVIEPIPRFEKPCIFSSSIKMAWPAGRAPETEYRVPLPCSTVELNPTYVWTPGASWINCSKFRRSEEARVPVADRSAIHRSVGGFHLRNLTLYSDGLALLPDGQTKVHDALGAHHQRDSASNRVRETHFSRPEPRIRPPLGRELGTVPAHPQKWTAQHRFPSSRLELRLQESLRRTYRSPCREW